MESSAPTLLVLAAGMGSRYGGLKQLDPMGPSGETVLDYSVYDAIRAGFEMVVFVIRRDIEQAFRESVGRRYAGRINVDYAFQEVDDLPGGRKPPEGRTKPWGTAHAVRAARHCLNAPFAVINADDFYGAEAYAIMARQLGKNASGLPLQLHMVGYPLDNTLSDHGEVNRGLCAIEKGLLASIGEVTGIRRHPDGRITGRSASGESIELSASAPVSMNFWGFPFEVFTHLEEQFTEFLDRHGNQPGAEFYIPSFVDTLISSGAAECRVHSSEADWFGVTYPEDKVLVQARLRALVDQGNYPTPLTGRS